MIYEDDHFSDYTRNEIHILNLKSPHSSTTTKKPHERPSLNTNQIQSNVHEFRTVKTSPTQIEG